ncbi:unnamed protein product [Rhizoctonia solani]|uniref:Uncharacterized protein n=1 Tax=Rhizoctonia solani TaxID=456999 RepID=A0A8H3B1G3_9AGAM|nr:unnamed protein product [Rhizoctonia solani]
MALTGTVRAALDHQATAWDGPPLYCIYSGPIQGVWAERHNVNLIIANYAQFHDLKACVVYSWTEARYVLSSQRSFKDILNSKGEWPLLYTVLLDLFGDEGKFILGPEVTAMLDTLCATSKEPEASLLRVLGGARDHASTISQILEVVPDAHAPRLWARPSLTLSHTQPLLDPNHPPYITRTPYWQPFCPPANRGLRVIDMDVHERMVLFDGHMLHRLNPSTLNQENESESMETRYVEIDS